jgi:indolepyruvate ferredoxin oxidoreductase
MMPVFRVLARLKGFRGTPLDPFGWTEDRRIERGLIVDYEATVAELIGRLDRGNHALALEIARIPEEIRGFGHVKRHHLDRAEKKKAELLAAFRKTATAARAG